MKSAKKTVPLYRINEFTYNDFLDFKDLAEKIGKNFNKKKIWICKLFIFRYKGNYFYTNCPIWIKTRLWIYFNPPLAVTKI